MKQFTEVELKLIRSAICNASLKNTARMIDAEKQNINDGIIEYCDDMKAMYKGILAKIDEE